MFLCIHVYIYIYISYTYIYIYTHEHILDDNGLQKKMLYQISHEQDIFLLILVSQWSAGDPSWNSVLSRPQCPQASLPKGGVRRDLSILGASQEVDSMIFLL